MLVHSSLRSLGSMPKGPATILEGLKSALGPEGHLLLPTLSYEQVHRDQPHFHWQDTPSNVGALPEWFRLQPTSWRSIHPTHSLAGQGPKIQAMLAKHELDHTPCGPHSPFHLLPEWNGQILMLGCGLRPNTSMHAIEEEIEPSYLYDPLPYSIEIHTPHGHYHKTYRPHGFQGWIQRYDRIGYLMHRHPGLAKGTVGSAPCYLIEAQALWEVAVAAFRKNPLHFVDRAQA